jgi:hypothetical protein
MAKASNGQGEPLKVIEASSTATRINAISNSRAFVDDEPLPPPLSTPPASDKSR